ncbi:MAG: ATP-binding protein [Magnetococcus sp. DMHC-1]
MQGVVATSATQTREGDLFNYSAFMLDAVSSKQPSEFELTFIDQGVRFQYGFSLMPERVVEEWLLVYKSAKPQMWFSRRFDPDGGKDLYEFGPHLTGKRSLWKESTRSNALFLSKAVDLNSEGLRPIYSWITKKLRIIGAGDRPPFHASILHAKTEEGKTELLRFLEAADLGIVGLVASDEKKLKQIIKMGLTADGKPAAVYAEMPMPVFLHQVEDIVAKIDLEDESAGTQKFFAFASFVINILKDGCVWVVDELDGSFHPLLVRFLIGLFHSIDNNKNGAQLIFTTHDVSILNTEIFRRDQIWFIEKDQTQSSKLYPLTDFSPRQKEAIDRGYLIGRYGALPFITNFNL